MATDTRELLRVGDLVLAAFDEAATYSTDPQVVSRLATLTVNHLLRWAPRTVARLRRQSTRDHRPHG